MSLFVSDDEEFMDGISKTENGTGTGAGTTPKIKQEHEDEQQLQKKLDQQIPAQEEESSSESEIETDDEILFEVPIHYKTPDLLKTIIIQNPTKQKQTKTKTKTNNNIHNTYQQFTNLQIKPQSKTIELSNNISELKFFNNEKANNNWNGLTNLTQKGNLISSDQKNYMLGKFVEIKQNSKTETQLYLSKIEYISQIRPNFKYLDDSKFLKQQSLRDLQANLDTTSSSETPVTNGSGSKVNVVQMSAKSTHENQPRLGGALVACKIEDEEDAVDYSIEELDSRPVTNVDNPDKEQNDAMDVDTEPSSNNNTNDKRKHLKSLLFGDNLDSELTSEMSKNEYLESLVKDTSTGIL